MSSTEAMVQCADGNNCKHSEDVPLQTECQKCKRPMHIDCGTPREEGASVDARVCAECRNGTTEEGQATQGPSKRRRLNLAEKLRALDMLESGVSLQEVADEFGSSKRAIMRMKQEGDVIRSLGQSGAKGSMKSRKQSNCVKYTALENKVAEVVEISRRNRISLTHEHVRNCVQRVREEMLKRDGIVPEEAKDLQDFNPTDFWIKSFARRKSIKLVSKAYQVAVAPSAEPTSQEATSLKMLLHKYDPDCIFSVHETTLFHKILPRRSYLINSTAEPNNKVFPADMSTSDRLTLIVCTNATGTCKIPLALIGAAKQPKCFRIRPCPLSYLTHPHTWFDRATFKQWFSEVFIPAVRKHSWRNIAVLVDNVVDGHIAEDPRGQIDILPLPGDLMSKGHPMEYGIIPSLKQKYRYAMLERVIELLPAREEFQTSSSRKALALRGLDDGHDPNFLDTAELLNTIWNRTSAQSIARSWISANILPDACTASLTATHGKSQAYGRMDLLLESCEIYERESLYRLDEILRVRNLKAKEGATAATLNIVNTLNSVPERDFETWLCLEDRTEIKTALVREAQEALLTSAALQIGNGVNETNGTAEVTVVAVGEERAQYEAQQSLPSLASLAELFGPIEEMISACDVRDAAAWIRQAKRALIAAKTKEMRGPLHGTQQSAVPVASSSHFPSPSSAGGGGLRR